MGELTAAAGITLLAVISPGADFAIVTKNSYLYGRKIGVLTALGIAFSVLFHAAYAVTAAAFILERLPQLLTLMKPIGAAYLIYIGYKAFSQAPAAELDSSLKANAMQSLKYGFFTNALNPKTALFVISIYTQIVSLSAPKIVLLGYGLFMSFAHLAWFSAVAVLFSSAVLWRKMLSQQAAVNRIIGSLLSLLGMLLLLANFQ
ncbi:LysE family transporter [Acinetobacter sp.]|uniref:LysE family transporter n=1 Tax=Acinetobacter sp. TaxID=472 RepID=UPI002FCA525E